MIEIRIIDKAHAEDIRLPNEPFSLFGRIAPSYLNGVWDYELIHFDERDKSEMCFPDENYDYHTMQENSIFVGAYDGDKCIGLAILQTGFFRYMYLYDLKVSRAYRGKHVGRALIARAKEITATRGNLGIYTIGQDNNAGACLFYLREGFRIGGLDTNVYKGTSQEGKADILFYLDI